MLIIKIIDRIIDIILFIFFLLLFLIGIYTIYDTIKIYNKASNDDLKMFKPVVTDNVVNWNMNDLSEDAIAWLTIDDTSIDYPVMQGKDNSEYLNKDPYGEYSLAGSIFLDYRNAKDFSDDYSLIYGHHMEHKYMFGALDAFTDKKYFNNHTTGTLIINNKIYNIKLFACLEADSSVSEIFVPSSAEDALEYTKQHAKIYNEINNTDKLLALSTCKYPETTERIILLGVIE